MKMTFKERLEAGLKAMGYREIPGVTRKYTTFVKDDESKRKLFVGKSGALRSGKCASGSFSLGDPSNQTAPYVRILKEGDNVLSPKPCPHCGSVTHPPGCCAQDGHGG